MEKSGGKEKIFVLGLDGIPHSLLQSLFDQGAMPYLSAFSRTHNIKKMNSVYPVISSVAWATFATGKNPAEHNIFGFIDRTPNPFALRIPMSGDKRAESIWDDLSARGKKSIVINVPVTYPPHKINGILISDFLCPDIGKSSYPDSINLYLKEREYIIDVDAGLARESKSGFLKQLYRAMDKRFEIAFELIREYDWDYFQLHVMETDRLLHFFSHDMPEQLNFLNRLDMHIGKFLNIFDREDKVIILSDHGFCQVKFEVQLNTWLKEQGLLKFNGLGTKLADYSSDSVCYSLVPGRFFINLKGREEKGSVEESDYNRLRQELKEKLLNLTDPQNGGKVIDKVFYREEIYSGPYLASAADIIAHPVRGYDLKSRSEAQEVFVPTPLINGMHTYDDAFITGANFNLDPVKSIQDVKEIILNNLN